MATAKGKVTINLSIDPETKDRLQIYAKEQHTNVSQLVTRWIWDQQLKDEKKERKD